MMIDKDYINSKLSTEIVLKIMNDLGEDSPKPDNSGNFIFKSICHGSDSRKLYLYTNGEIPVFHCYSQCGCNFDIYELVMKVKQCQFPEALEFVASYFGGAVRREGFIFNDLSQDWAMIKRYRMLRRTAPSFDLLVHDRKILGIFNKLYYKKWFEEFIKLEAMERFEIGYDAVRNRIIIPHFNIDGGLVGIKGRALQASDIEAGYKYLPLTVQGIDYAFEQKYNLYGLHKTKNAIKRLKKVIIFESEKSVLQCESYYGEDNFALATCNSSISPFQRQLILNLGVEEVFIAFDKEFTSEDYDNKTEAYVNYCNKLTKLANMFSPYARTYIVWDGYGTIGYKESPSDNGKEMLEFLMKSKHEVRSIEV